MVGGGGGADQPGVLAGQEHQAGLAERGGGQHAGRAGALQPHRLGDARAQPQGGEARQHHREQPDIGDHRRPGDRQQGLDRPAAQHHERRQQHQGQRQQRQQQCCRHQLALQPPQQHRAGDRHRDADREPDRAIQADQGAAPPGGGWTPAAGLVRRRGGEQGDRGVGRQHVVRELGGDQLEHQPVRHDPAQQVAHRGGAAAAPHEGDRHRREQRAGPEGDREGGQVVARRQAGRLLAGRPLAQEVGADRALEEQAVAHRGDGDAPGQHDRERERHAPGGTQPAPPEGPTLHQRQGQRRAEGRDQHHRALQHQAHAQRRPEGGRDRGRGRGAVVAVLPDAQQGRLQGQDGGQQAGVDGGEAALGGQQHGDGQQQRAEQARLRVEQGGADPRGQQHGGDRGQQGRDAVGPRGAVAPRAVQRAGGGHGGGLQPVDAGGLEVARLVLEADVDKVAGAQHLRAGLHVARLVAVERRQAGPSGQEQRQHEGGQQRVVAGGQRHRMVRGIRLPAPVP